jgi:small multidrug resistance pump
MFAAVVLALSILAEVAATLALQASEGFSRPVPVAIVVLGYGASFFGLSIVLRRMELSLVYAIWSGAGTALVAAIGVVLLGEATSATKLASIALIVAGVIGVNLGGAH